MREDNLPSYKQIETRLAYANHDINTLREELAKERELRKDLVQGLEFLTYTFKIENTEIESLIQKALAKVCFDKPEKGHGKQKKTLP